MATDLLANRGRRVPARARIVIDAALVFAFACEKAALPMRQLPGDGGFLGGAQGIGLEIDGQLVAGVLYERFSGPNVWMHIAAEPGGLRWLSAVTARVAFSYPFLQLGVQRITGYVEASNVACLRFAKHLGFKTEAVLAGAARDGGDVEVLVLWRKDCRYVDPQ